MNRFGDTRSLRATAGLFLTALLVCAITAPRRAAADVTGPETAPPPVTKEYLHQQAPGTSLVFRLESFEAEFESVISEAGEKPFKRSGMPGLRLGPVFQFVEAVSAPRQLVIEVSIARRSDRARIDMELVRFDPAGPDHKLLQQAYRLLSHAQEAAPAGRLDLWQAKVISARQAVNLFDRLGMQEPMLWAEFYAGHLMLERLGDAVSAVESARMVLTGAQRSRDARLQLAARQLEGRALMALASARSDAATLDRARAVLAQAAQAAAELDYQHERARALFNTGLSWEQQTRYDAAFTSYDQALQVTALNGDTDLANAIRRHAAELHERLGDTEAAIAMMQQIESRTPASGAPLAGTPASPDTPSQRDTLRYLYEQGRLLHKAYRHVEAIAVLRRALDLAARLDDDNARGPVGLLLGQALYQSGRFEEAAEQLVDAIPRAPASAFAPELMQAWATLATVRRHRGEFEAAAATREQQAKFANRPAGLARLAYDLGVDEWIRAGHMTATARDRFREAARRAAQARLPGLAALSRLRLCVGGESCPELPQPPRTGWAGSQPADTFEARWLQVEWYRAQGRGTTAAQQVEQLLGDILFYRAELPGVLGAWYRARRESVFDTYLNLSLADGRSERAAYRTLAALDAIRTPTGKAAPALPFPVDGTSEQRDPLTDRLRSLFAVRAEGGGETGPGELDRLLRQMDDRASRLSLAARAAALQNRLGQLPPQTSLLVYYIGEDAAHAWLGDAERLRIVSPRWDANRSRTLARESAALRERARGRDADGLTASLDAIGRLLLPPVADALRPDIAFLPLGVLQGVPLDALTTGGPALGAHHRVVNILSLDALDRFAAAVDTRETELVFLAGNRQTGAGDFTVTRAPSAELRVVADHYVGPGLTVRQGAALQWDEFRDIRFTGAGLLHLAMPAVENLGDTTGSHLLMSDNADPPEHLYLFADELPAPVAARLAVLSQCSFDGISPSALGTRGGLIEGLLGAGVQRVVASLWPLGDAAGAAFMRRFYGHLESGETPLEALNRTKRDYLAEGRAAITVWPALQIYMD
ncbi:CHAT domain-containing protein [Elongatibacter sediminis]|uniref:CHAT domain-containing protein n=1 Tax=Elongatibacter sediminis TaxID=3119006 RepID=A0AAW9R662_9GAMM